MIFRSLVQRACALAILWLIQEAPSAQAHGQNHHTVAPSSAEVGTSAPGARASVEMTRKHCLTLVGTEYLARVKEILLRTCGDCHSDRTRYPWYHAVPGIREMIDRDIAEARTHLDISQDFPFKGHATPEEDLLALRKVVLDDTMPPWSYSLMHSEASLSANDRNTVFSWIDESLKALSDLAGGVADGR